MSEYQWVHFQAIDRPLDDSQLEFMERQSSRANISRWEFTNEYHYGDFRGNDAEMLRCGYDVHLLFANYGVRFLKFRLPQMPCDKKTFKAFATGYGVSWIPDKKGSAGILSITPEGDGRFFEYLEDVPSFLPQIAHAREMLIHGDLRPLYLFWLVTSHDDAKTEPPVPAGLGEICDQSVTNRATTALEAIAEFYDIPGELISVAAETSLPASSPCDSNAVVRSWLKQQNKTELHELAEKLLLGDVAERHGTLSKIRRAAKQPAWPVSKPSRTFGQLSSLEADAVKVREEKEQAALQTLRDKQLKVVAADPKKVIRRIDRCVATKKINGYREAVSHLKDLGDALGPEFAGRQLEKMMERYARYSSLKRELREAGFDV